MWLCWRGACQVFTTPWVSLPALDKLELQYMPVIPEPGGRSRKIRSPKAILDHPGIQDILSQNTQHIATTAKGNKNATYMQWNWCHWFSSTLRMAYPDTMPFWAEAMEHHVLNQDRDFKQSQHIHTHEQSEMNLCVLACLCSVPFLCFCTVQDSMPRKWCCPKQWFMSFLV